MTDAVKVQQAEKTLRERMRQCLIMELGALEDYMIALGELKERSIVPRREREYNERTTYTELR